MKGIKTLFIIIPFLLLGCQADPADFKYVDNFTQGLVLSQQSTKPLFIYFTGFGVSHNEFFDHLLLSPKVLQTLNEDFVSVLLYVDDKQKLTTVDTLKLHTIDFLSTAFHNEVQNAKTIGNLNALIEQHLITSNAQPTYVLLDNEGNLLIKPFGYTAKNEVYFLAKLKEGLSNFKN